MNRIYAVLTAVAWPVIFGQCLLAQSEDRAQQSGRESRSPLVDADWLAEQIKSNSDLIIVDLPLRKTNYETGHVPGAIFVDWRSDIISSERNDLYRLPAKQELQRLMSRIGATPKSTVVLTDNMGNRASVRMYFTLKYFGHADVRILDGGTEAWKRSGRELSTEPPKMIGSCYQIDRTNDQFIVPLEAVLEAIENEDFDIIDGRPADQYSGQSPGKAFHSNRAHDRSGHVPTAISIPWSDNLKPDGTFKSLQELRDLYRSRGVDVDGEIIAYCNEGLHAAMPWFVIRELFGNGQIQVYDNSMAEWANRQDTPIETGK